MAETEVASPPAPPAVEEQPAVVKDAPERREGGRPERPRREPEEIPDMTVEEAQKALNALPKVRKVHFLRGSSTISAILLQLL